MENSIPKKRKKGSKVLPWVLKPLNRWTLLRWVDVVLLAVVGSAVCFLLSPVLTRVRDGAVWVVEYLWGRAEGAFGTGPVLFGAWPPPLLAVYAVVFVGVALAVTPLIALGGLRWGHARSLLLYPPTWVGGLLPAVLYGWVGTHVGELTPDALFAAGALLLFSVIAALAATSLFSRGPSERSWWRSRRCVKQKLPTAQETLDAFASYPEERLLPWLMRDDPVSEPEEDLFEHHVHAQRIAELVTGGELGRIGLVGAWGSGKTTVLNLTDFLLHRSKPFSDEYRERWRETYPESSWRRRECPPAILTCWVRAWGFIREPAAPGAETPRASNPAAHTDTRIPRRGAIAVSFGSVTKRPARAPCADRSGQPVRRHERPSG